MRLDIRYRTGFEYDHPVRESQNELRACPLSDARQQLVSYRVTTTPSSRVFGFTDYWGTRVDQFGVREPHLALEIEAEAVVETRHAPMLVGAPRLDTLGDVGFVDDHIEYLERTPHADWGGDITSTARRLAEASAPDVVSVVLAVHRWVSASVDYVPGATYVGVDVDRVFADRRGVCQDYAHLAVALCRSIGVPARYVSGYLFTSSDRSAAEPDHGAVEVQTHAWFEAAVPGLGWLALDPTNGHEVGLRHVKIGHGRDYADVTPLRGVYSGPGMAPPQVSVEIRRITAPGEAPPVARPVDVAQRAAQARAAAASRWNAAVGSPTRLAQQAAQSQQQ